MVSDQKEFKLRFVFKKLFKQEASTDSIPTSNLLEDVFRYLTPFCSLDRCHEPGPFQAGQIISWAITFFF